MELAPASACHLGPPPLVCCNLLTLPHLDDLALAQLKGTWLQHNRRILITLRCLGTSCRLAFKTTQHSGEAAGSRRACIAHVGPLSTSWHNLEKKLYSASEKAHQSRWSAHRHIARPRHKVLWQGHTRPLLRLLSNFLPLLAKVPM